MTLVEIANSLQERAIRRRERDSREGEAERIRARTANLTTLLSRIGSAQQKAKVLEKYGCAALDAGTPPLDLLTVYDVVASGVTDGPVYRQADWDGLALALTRFAINFENAVKSSIGTARKSFLGDVTLAEIGGYSNDPTTEVKAQDLARIFQDLDTKNWLTGSALDLAALLDGAKRFRDSYQNLRDDGAPEELRTFLAAARSQQGASPDSLTSTLRKEIADRKLDVRLRLVIR